MGKGYLPSWLHLGGFLNTSVPDFSSTNKRQHLRCFNLKLVIH